jgi:hypothetical protein
MPGELNQIIEWALGLFIVGSVGTAVRILSRISTSIERLNQKVAVIIEKVTHHDKVLDRYESRLNEIEKRRHSR